MCHVSYDISPDLWVAQDSFGVPSPVQLNTAGLPRGRNVVRQSSCEESDATDEVAPTLRHGIGCAARKPGLTNSIAVPTLFVAFGCVLKEFD